jgi:serine-type D-Ala-D-Ala carboxypeptidase/endopeptidase (penicillin-binding protein 4)
MRYLSCLLCFISSLSFATADQTLQQQLDKLIEQTLPHATVSIMIKDPQTGKILYERGADKLLNPASNVKMFTAAAALYYLGPSARYSTSLSQYKEDFYITFTGSPSLTTENLKELVRHIPLKTIKGSIFLDASQFKQPDYAPGASYDDLGWYYDAPSPAVMLDRNAVAYNFITDKKTGGPVTIKPQDDDHKLTLINELHTVTKKQEKDHCALNIEIKPNNTLKLYGCLAQAKEPRRMQLAIPDPKLYAKEIIQDALKENNIALKGRIADGRTPTNAKLIRSYQSNELIKLITHMLEESDNLYADSITKRLGHALTGEGTYKQGAFAIKKILADHIDIDVELLELADGAGTRYNLTTAKQLVMFLTYIYNDKKMYPLFMNALPKMGTSGTLKDRLKDSRLKNKVFAKTGTMHDISALSGYIAPSPDKTIIFSIIINGISEGKLAKAKELEDKILFTFSDLLYN